jgi:hypothetical protein
MHRTVLLIYSVGLVLVSAIAVAQVQPGSIGGTIGKQNKSVSGEDHPASLGQKSKRLVRSRDGGKEISTNNDGTGSRKTFANPMLNGMRIDWCLSGGLGGC